MKKPKPNPDAWKCLRERPETDDYIDPVRDALEIASSIKSMIAPEECEWAEDNYNCYN